MDSIYLLLDRLVSETKRATYKQKVGEILVWIQRVLNSQLSKEVLSNLVRAIYGDAAYSLKVDHSWHNYMEDYLNRLQRQFDQEWDRLNREQDESMINMDLTILFNKAALLEVEGYSEKVSNALMELELNSFTHTTAIQIMKSFILMKFEKDFKETIKRILVDGFFEDKAFQATLTNIVYECEHSLDTVTQFEQSLETAEPGTENVLQKLIEAYKQGNKVSATLNNLIIKIDKQAGQIVESNANNFNRLGQIILEIINDFKLKTPIKISNIKVLGGEKNSDIVKLLVERTKDIIRFINIMKRFTIIQSGPLVLKKPTP